MKSDRYYIFWISIIKLLKKFNQFNIKQFKPAIIIMEENIIMLRDPKTCYFDFDWPIDVDKKLKHEIEFVIKSKESLGENE